MRSIIMLLAVAAIVGCSPTTTSFEVRDPRPVEITTEAQRTYVKHYKKI